MTNEELLNDAETALNIAMNETQSSDEIQARAQASIAASLLVLARNSEPTSEMCIGQDEVNKTIDTFNEKVETSLIYGDDYPEPSTETVRHG
jgi:hypothetical protein